MWGGATGAAPGLRLGRAAPWPTAKWPSTAAPVTPAMASPIPGDSRSAGAAATRPAGRGGREPAEAAGSGGGGGHVAEEAAGEVSIASPTAAATPALPSAVPAAVGWPAPAAAEFWAAAGWAVAARGGAVPFSSTAPRAGCCGCRPARKSAGRGGWQLGVGPPGDAGSVLPPACDASMPSMWARSAARRWGGMAARAGSWASLASRRRRQKSAAASAAAAPPSPRRRAAPRRAGAHGSAPGRRRSTVAARPRPTASRNASAAAATTVTAVVVPNRSTSTNSWASTPVTSASNARMRC